MIENNKTDLFLDHLKSYILPFIDYSELQQSYETNMVYAKGVLNRLHTTMGLIYGGETLTGIEGDVVIPGVIRGKESGKLCLALLTLDMSSSGEHWGTDYLCKYHVISQDGSSPICNNGSVLASEVKEINDAYLPYDYAYTATIPDDIHVDFDNLHYQIKDVLEDFHNHHAELLFEGEVAETPAQAALHEPDIYDDEATAALREQLLSRLDANLESYFDDIRSNDGLNIPSMSSEIAAVTGAHYYLSEIHNFHTSELEYLLQFQNPLSVVADAFQVAGMDDYSDVMWAIFDRQDALGGDYPFMSDGSDAAAMSSALEEKLDSNLADSLEAYRMAVANPLLTNDELIGLSENLAAITAAHQYLKNEHDFEESELEFLTNCDYPLDAVANVWPDIASYMDVREGMRDFFEGIDNIVDKPLIESAKDKSGREESADSPEGLFSQIAKKHCHFDTLETRRRDSLDFHEVSVWGLKAALEEAFAAGADHQLAQSKAANKAEAVRKENRAGRDAGEKPSVLEQIREAAKAPREPHKNKETRNKSGPEL